MSAKQRREQTLARMRARAEQGEAPEQPERQLDPTTQARVEAMIDAEVERQTTRTTERINRVRKTLDLYPADNREVNRWLLDAADELGEDKVTWQDAAEGLVKLLLTDETVSRRLIAHLRVRNRQVG